MKERSTNNLRETWVQTSSGHLPLHSSTIHTNTCVLSALEGPHEGESFLLTGERYHIGRAEWCDISLVRDMRASRHHCELMWSEEGLCVRDLGSRNGLQLDGVRVYHALLQPEQSLQVGNTRFVLREDDTKATIEVLYHDQTGLLVGNSNKMREIFSLLQRIAPRDLPVLLTGETGTGKTSVARAIHAQSARKDGPFVQVNCGALSPSLIEAELFGYEKGAFTGASQRHRGFFEQAHEGTLFLDEIAELPTQLQAKLLDVLERKQVRRLGARQEHHTDFRLISATHQQLPLAIASGTFREDLFYRLAVAELQMPPLRERLEDIPLLVTYVLARHDPNNRIDVPEATIRKLQQSIWPGNVRQLSNVLERSLLFAENNVLHPDSIRLLDGMVHLASDSVQHTQSDVALRDEDGAFRPLEDVINDAERRALVEVLEHFHWDTKVVREELSISKSWLYKLLKKHGLTRPAS